MKNSNVLILIVVVLGLLGVLAVLPDSDPFKMRVNAVVYNVTGLDISRQGDMKTQDTPFDPGPIAVVGEEPPAEVAPVAPTHLPFDESHGSGSGLADKLIKNANGGDSSAQFSLGRMYLEGNSVSKDLVTAYMWFNLARANGHAKAKEEVNQIMKLMDNRQIAEGQRLAAIWWDTYKN